LKWKLLPEEYLAKRLNEIREARLYGLRDARTFRAAVTTFLQEFYHKKRIKDDAMHVKQLDPFIGSLELKQVHMGTLQALVARTL
jgi:hypothetical protein